MREHTLLGATGVVRVALAISEALAGAALLAAFRFSWLEISYVNSTARASTSWADYLRTDFNSSQSVLVDLMVPAAFAALVLGIAGLLVRARRRSLATLIAFAAAEVGVLSLLTELNSGALYPTDFATISPGIGMILFAGGSLLGLVLAAADLVLQPAPDSSSDAPDHAPA
jgi:hypothetical protein